MSKVNYDEISKIYDQVRDAEAELIWNLIEGGNVHESSVVLDIGCGTGNYTNLLQKMSRAKVYGLDQSQGMLEKAKEKNKDITFQLGNACEIPFQEQSFDFIYMTDVIHHVPDIHKMFEEIQRVLKPNGKVCICTQSHRQIEKRCMAEIFPGTAVVDKGRYPDIDQIQKSAVSQGLNFMKVNVLGEEDDVEINDNYLELIEKKGFSMLHLISEEEYQEGLSKLRSLLQQGPFIKKSAGETLVWFMKEK